ncbi:flagellin [Cryobacterium sp. N21]|uniref:flagellin N-terminal helical domain-containing protein n=1 Tax=Cryobacterium sp. N21 TaxID=2048289 RepID=UPI003513E456
MQVNTNVAANNAYRNLATTQNDLSKSLEKLSSGLRINRAADDAAGLAVSEGLKSQVGGLTVASRNAQDAVSVIQTAEGSLNEVQSILQRVRDLAVQAGNDSNNTESRAAIQTEVTALTAELTRISESTNFNGTQLLDGTKPTLSFQVGANGDGSSQIEVDLSKADVGSVVSKLANGIPSEVTTAAKAATVKDAAVAGFDSSVVSLKAGEASGNYTVTQAGVGKNVFLGTTNASMNQAAISSALSTAFGGDYTIEEGADGLYTFKKSFVGDAAATQKAITFALNTTQNAADATASTDGKALVNATPVFQAGSVATYNDNEVLEVKSELLTALKFSSAGEAANAIKLLDSQITAISTARASLGADQNRFESVIKNLAVSKENLTAAGSRIRDTDMAEEMVKYTRANILSQAGTAMLAQANQSNSGVLQLLQ